MDSDFTSKVARKISRRVRAGEFSGAVLIRRGRTDIFRRAYSFANRTWNVKNTTETRFRIASVGKLFTAAGVMQLIEAGKLSLDTRVVELLGLEETCIPAEVTIRHLLTMTSGIADWINEEAENFDALWAQFCREHPLSLLRGNADYLPIFSRLEPYGPLGEKFRYSNAGFVLLGLSIEKVGGLSYFDYMRRNIFARAGMSQTDFIDLDDVRPNVAEGYVAIMENGVRTGWRKNIYATTAGGAGDGGETSTLDDMARFLRKLREGKLFSRELVTTMLTPKVDVSDAPGMKYGFGCFIALDEKSRILRWGHTGEEEGVSCRLYHYPLHKLDVVVAGNQTGCAGRVFWDIHESILEDE